MVVFYKKLIQLSVNITRAFCNNSDFLRELVDRLDQGSMVSDNFIKNTNKDTSLKAKKHTKMTRAECSNPSVIVQKEL